MSTWQERLIAERDELQKRILKLQNLIEKMDNGSLDFTPKTPRNVFDNQLSAMNHYALCLNIRIWKEEIDGESLS